MREFSNKKTMEGSKVYLITGASSGIGAGIAKCLSEEDGEKKRLVLVARRLDRLQEVAKELHGAEQVHIIQKDLSNLDSAKEVVEETVNKFGSKLAIIKIINKLHFMINAGLDVLINNAGKAKRCPVDEQSVEEAKEMMDLNFFSPMALTQAALPHIRKTKGNIIFISSVAAGVPYGSTAAYGASKAALTQFAKVLALEEAPNGVRANVISPGGINTEILERATKLKG